MAYYKDSIEKEFLRRNDVFASIFNAIVFRKHPIDPNELTELDSQGLAVMPEKGKAKQTNRDVVKLLTKKINGKTRHVILAIENQTYIDYTMPQRVGISDFMNYDRQIKIYRNRARKKLKGDEYISGFPKKRKLIPVITLVIYWSYEPWTGPTKLSDMMDLKELDIYEEYIHDYKINVISPAAMTDRQFDLLTPDAKAVMLFVKYSDDPDKLKELGKQEEFRKLHRDVVRMINAVTGSHMPIEEEVINMCKAIDILEQRAADEATENTTKKNIKISYEACKELDPEAKDSDIFNVLSRRFNKPLSYIKAICM